MRIIKIRAPNFSKWQKAPKNGKRDWLAIDINFFMDPKVRYARELCPDAPDCFISLWREMDLNGEMVINLAALKSYWKMVLCVTSNHFDAERRLQALSDAGLIVFEVGSNELLNDFKSDSKVVLNDSKTTLEQPEKPVALHATTEQNITEQDNTPLPPKGGKAKRASRLSEDWEPDEKLLTWALEAYPTVDTRQQTFEFKNHFIASGKAMLDWGRTWQNWIARSIRFGGRPVSSQAGTKVDPRQASVPRISRSGRFT